MKVGEIVICIVDKNTTNNLTNNKQYTILELTNDIHRARMILVKNDNGVECSYYPYRFKTLSLHREEQLDNLGI
jgi:hypothetical protein